MITRATGRGAVARRAAIDLSLVAASLLSQLPFLFWSDPWSVWAGIVAAAAVLLWRRHPLAVILLALPGFIWGEAFVPVAIGLTVLAMRERHRWRLVGAATVVSAAWFIPERVWEEPQFILNAVLWAVIYIGVPILVGILIRTRVALAQRVDELVQLREQERRHAAESALARERALLAREMHDVVSHHVTLIAIHAGALQVASPDESARATAGTIRSLASVTMEELRTMVGVLRDARGRPRTQAPEPSSAELQELLAQSDLVVHGDIPLPDFLSADARKALYRFVQEGLTNARKHSTGADVTLASETTGGHFIASLHAGPPVERPLALPSANHGLIGLRERAALLGGSLSATLHGDGSHLLIMSLPLERSSS